MSATTPRSQCFYPKALRRAGPSSGAAWAVMIQRWLPCHVQGRRWQLVASARRRAGRTGAGPGDFEHHFPCEASSGGLQGSQRAACCQIDLQRNAGLLALACLALTEKQLSSSLRQSRPPCLSSAAVPCTSIPCHSGCTSRRSSPAGASSGSTRSGSVVDLGRGIGSTPALAPCSAGWPGFNTGSRLSCLLLHLTARTWPAESFRGHCEGDCLRLTGPSGGVLRALVVFFLARSRPSARTASLAGLMAASCAGRPAQPPGSWASCWQGIAWRLAALSAGLFGSIRD